MIQIPFNFHPYSRNTFINSSYTVPVGSYVRVVANPSTDSSTSLTINGTGVVLYDSVSFWAKSGDVLVSSAGCRIFIEEYKVIQ